MVWACTENGRREETREDAKFEWRAAVGEEDQDTVFWMEIKEIQLATMLEHENEGNIYIVYSHIYYVYKYMHLI